MIMGMLSRGYSKMINWIKGINGRSKMMVLIIIIYSIRGNGALINRVSNYQVSSQHQSKRPPCMAASSAASDPINSFQY
jgi:hypothetical protein